MDKLKKTYWEAELKNKEGEPTKVKGEVPNSTMVKQSHALLTKEEQRGASVLLDSLFNLLRLSLREINGKKVVFSDLAGEGLDNYFTLPQLSLLQNYMSQLQMPSEEEDTFFTNSLKVTTEG